jgi:hypothetical protein
VIMMTTCIHPIPHAVQFIVHLGAGRSSLPTPPYPALIKPAWAEAIPGTEGR